MFFRDMVDLGHQIKRDHGALDVSMAKLGDGVHIDAFFSDQEAAKALAREMEGEGREVSLALRGGDIRVRVGPQGGTR
jgi:hypothetical protein